jgi:hypothetical protein
MENQFTQAKQALRLKALNFTEKCFGRFCTYQDKKDSWYFDHDEFVDWNSKNNPEIISAPLWQQAFDWINEKYNLYSWIENYYNEEFFPKIEEMNPPISKILDRDKLRILSERSFNILDARIILLDKLLDLIENNLIKNK